MMCSDWIAIAAIAVAVLLAVGGLGWRLSWLLGSLNQQVAGLAMAIDALTKQVAEDREERQRLWEGLDGVRERVTKLEAKS